MASSDGTGGTGSQNGAGMMSLLSQLQAAQGGGAPTPAGGSGRPAMTGLQNTGGNGSDAQTPPPAAATTPAPAFKPPQNDRLDSTTAPAPVAATLPMGGGMPGFNPNVSYTQGGYGPYGSGRGAMTGWMPQANNAYPPLAAATATKQTSTPPPTNTLPAPPPAAAQAPPPPAWAPAGWKPTAYDLAQMSPADRAKYSTPAPAAAAQAQPPAAAAKTGGEPEEAPGTTALGTGGTPGPDGKFPGDQTGFNTYGGATTYHWKAADPKNTGYAGGLWYDPNRKATGWQWGMDPKLNPANGGGPGPSGI